MAERIRVAVVGAGAIGLSAAVRAAELGAAVTVLDRATPASGSSGLSAGIFNRQAVDPLDVEIRVRAERFLATLERDHGLRLARNGYVRVAYHDEHLRAYERSLAVERELGVHDARLLDRTGLQRLVPELRCDDLAGGLYGPSDGHLDGRLLCSALVERGEGLGVDYRFRTALLGTGDGPGGVLELRTAGETVACDVVVNAAGAWAPAVGELLGAPAPIVAERHQVCVVRPARPRAIPLPTVQLYVPGMHGEALYVRGEGSEQMLAGLHSHEIVHGVSADPDAYRRTVDDDYAEAIARLLLDRMPGLDRPALAGGWAGLYPLSPDGKPQIGPYRACPSVVAAGGGGGVGLTLGLVYGQLAAEWAVLGEPRSLPRAAGYLPDRPAPTPVAA
jgi:glycine/D-amino acid oxidase-like deaminating enzyme